MTMVRMVEPRDPAKPAQHQTRHENLHHPEPVVLDVQQSPGERNARDGVASRSPGAPAPETGSRGRRSPRRPARPRRWRGTAATSQPASAAVRQTSTWNGGTISRPLIQSMASNVRLRARIADHRDDDFGAPRHDERRDSQRGRPAPQLRGKDQHRDLHRHRREGAEGDHHAVIAGDRTARPAGRPEAERNGCQHHAEQERRQRPGQRRADAPRRVRTAASVSWIDPA